MKARAVRVGITAWLLAGLVLLFAPGTAHAAACVWTGNTSTDWAITGNWTTCQGADQTAPPLATDTVTIGTATRQPVIGGNVTIAGLTLTGGASLTINSSAALNVNGNVLMSVDGGATATISNAGIFQTAGTSTISRNAGSGDANFALTGAGSWTFTGDVTQNSYTNVSLGSGTYTFKGDLTRAGSFDPGTSTITFDVGSTSNLRGTVQHHFYNLVVANNTTLNHAVGSVAVRIRSNLTVDTGSSFNQAGDAMNREVRFDYDASYPMSTLSGGGTIKFARVTIDPTKTVNAGSTSITIGATTGASSPWANSGTFNGQSSTITFANSTTSAVSGGVNNFNNLTISNTVGITLSANATVSGTLALTSGDLNTGANTLTLESGATITGAGDVVGTVRRTSFSGAQAYNNATTTVDFASAPTTQMDVKLTKSAPTGLTRAVTRYYALVPSGGSPNATIQLGYKASEVPGAPFNEANNALWRYDTTQSRWVLQGGTVNTASHYVTLSGVTQFSDWAISDHGAPTAVTLSTFTAHSETPFQNDLAVVGLAGALGIAVTGLAFARHRSRAFHPSNSK